MYTVHKIQYLIRLERQAIIEGVFAVNTIELIRFRVSWLCAAAVIVMLIMVPLRAASAGCIPLEVDWSTCVSVSPEDFVQQELMPYLQADAQAMDALNLAGAAYTLLQDVLYLDRATGNLVLWEEELLAVCIPYKEGTMGSIRYRFYAAQDPIKCVLLCVNCMVEK